MEFCSSQWLYAVEAREPRRQESGYLFSSEKPRKPMTPFLGMNLHKRLVACTTQNLPRSLQRYMYLLSIGCVHQAENVHRIHLQFEGVYAGH